MYPWLGHLLVILIISGSLLERADAYERPGDYDAGPALYAGTLTLTGQGTLFGAGFRHLNGRWLDLGAELYADPVRPGSFLGTGTLGAALPLRDLVDIPLTLCGALQGGTELGAGSNWYLNAPIGLRYSLKRGTAETVFEGAYHAAIISSGFTSAGDTAHFHFSGALRVGAFCVAAYKDVGAVFNGFGGQIGLAL